MPKQTLMAFLCFALTLLSVEQQGIAKQANNVFAETMELALLTLTQHTLNALAPELLDILELTATFLFALL